MIIILSWIFFIIFFVTLNIMIFSAILKVKNQKVKYIWMGLMLIIDILYLYIKILASGVS
jgi:hypothetical protein